MSADWNSTPTDPVAALRQIASSVEADPLAWTVIVCLAAHDGAGVSTASIAIEIGVSEEASERTIGVLSDRGVAISAARAGAGSTHRLHSNLPPVVRALGLALGGAQRSAPYRTGDLFAAVGRMLSDGGGPMLEAFRRVAGGTSPAGADGLPDLVAAGLVEPLISGIGELTHVLAPSVGRLLGFLEAAGYLEERSDRPLLRTLASWDALALLSQLRGGPVADMEGLIQTLADGSFLERLISGGYVEVVRHSGLLDITDSGRALVHALEHPIAPEEYPDFTAAVGRFDDADTAAALEQVYRGEPIDDGWLARVAMPFTEGPPGGSRQRRARSEDVGTVLGSLPLAPLLLLDRGPGPQETLITAMDRNWRGLLQGLVNHGLVVYAPPGARLTSRGVWLMTLLERAIPVATRDVERARLLALAGALSGPGTLKALTAPPLTREDLDQIGDDGTTLASLGILEKVSGGGFAPSMGLAACIALLSGNAEADAPGRVIVPPTVPGLGTVLQRIGYSPSQIGAAAGVDEARVKQVAATAIPRSMAAASEQAISALSDAVGAVLREVAATIGVGDWMIPDDCASPAALERAAAAVEAAAADAVRTFRGRFASLTDVPRALASRAMPGPAGHQLHNSDPSLRWMVESRDMIRVYRDAVAEGELVQLLMAALQANGGDPTAWLTSNPIADVRSLGDLRSFRARLDAFVRGAVGGADRVAQLLTLGAAGQTGMAPADLGRAAGVDPALATALLRDGAPASLVAGHASSVHRIATALVEILAEVAAATQSDLDAISGSLGIDDGEVAAVLGRSEAPVPEWLPALAAAVERIAAGRVVVARDQFASGGREAVMLGERALPAGQTESLGARPITLAWLVANRDRLAEFCNTAAEAGRRSSLVLAARGLGLGESTWAVGSEADLAAANNALHGEIRDHVRQVLVTLRSEDTGASILASLPQNLRRDLDDDARWSPDWLAENAAVLASARDAMPARMALAAALTSRARLPLRSDVGGSSNLEAEISHALGTIQAEAMGLRLPSSLLEAFHLDPRFLREMALVKSPDRTSWAMAHAAELERLERVVLTARLLPIPAAIDEFSLDRERLEEESAVPRGTLTDDPSRVRELDRAGVERILRQVDDGVKGGLRTEIAAAAAKGVDLDLIELRLDLPGGVLRRYLAGGTNLSLTDAVRVARTIGPLVANHRRTVPTPSTLRGVRPPESLTSHQAQADAERAATLGVKLTSKLRSVRAREVEAVAAELTNAWVGLRAAWTDMRADVDAAGLTPELLQALLGIPESTAAMMCGSVSPAAADLELHAQVVDVVQAAARVCRLPALVDALAIPRDEVESGAGLPARTLPRPYEAPARVSYDAGLTLLPLVAPRALQAFARLQEQISGARKPTEKTVGGYMRREQLTADFMAVVMGPGAPPLSWMIDHAAELGALRLALLGKQVDGQAINRRISELTASRQQLFADITHPDAGSHAFLPKAMLDAWAHGNRRGLPAALFPAILNWMDKLEFGEQEDPLWANDQLRRRMAPLLVNKVNLAAMVVTLAPECNRQRFAMMDTDHSATAHFTRAESRLAEMLVLSMEIEDADSPLPGGAEIARLLGDRRWPARPEQRITVISERAMLHCPADTPRAINWMWDLINAMHKNHALRKDRQVHEALRATLLEAELDLAELETPDFFRKARAALGEAPSRPITPVQALDLAWPRPKGGRSAWFAMENGVGQASIALEELLQIQRVMKVRVRARGSPGGALTAADRGALATHEAVCRTLRDLVVNHAVPLDVVVRRMLMTGGGPIAAGEIADLRTRIDAFLRDPFDTLEADAPALEAVAQAARLHRWTVRVSLRCLGMMAGAGMTEAEVARALDVPLNVVQVLTTPVLALRPGSVDETMLARARAALSRIDEVGVGASPTDVARFLAETPGATAAALEQRAHELWSDDRAPIRGFVEALRASAPAALSNRTGRLAVMRAIRSARPPIHRALRELTAPAPSWPSPFPEPAAGQPGVTGTAGLE